MSRRNLYLLFFVVIKSEMELKKAVNEIQHLKEKLAQEEEVTPDFLSCFTEIKSQFSGARSLFPTSVAKKKTQILEEKLGEREEVAPLCSCSFCVTQSGFF